MVTMMTALGPWGWFIAGVLLLIAEIVAPGVFMLWLGLAALLVGAVSLAVDWSWQAQFIAFAVGSIVAIPLWRRIARKLEAPTDQPFLNHRAEALVGRVFTLDQPIVDGVGTVGVEDSVWRIAGPDVPAGSRIKVTGIAGTALHVEPIGS